MARREGSRSQKRIRARDADALAAFGGIVGLNRPLDDLTAAIVSTFIEAVVAPSVLPEALPVLQTKANMRVVTANFDALAGAPGHGRELRSILGGLLVQRRDEVGEARSEWPTGDLKVVTARQPSTDECAPVCLARDGTREIEYGDLHRWLSDACDRRRAMSRVDAVKVATMKAAGWDLAVRRPLAGTVAASDAFFHFATDSAALGRQRSARWFSAGCGGDRGCR